MQPQHYPQHTYPPATPHQNHAIVAITVFAILTMMLGSFLFFAFLASHTGDNRAPVTVASSTPATTTPPVATTTQPIVIRKTVYVTKTIVQPTTYVYEPQPETVPLPEYQHPCHHGRW